MCAVLPPAPRRALFGRDILPPLARRVREGFSLVELLAVMAVVATVLVLLATSLADSGKALSLETGGSRMVGLISLARQQAVSRNVMSAFVVSMDSSAKGGRRAFSLYEIAPRSDGADLSSADWKQIHPWELLPDGVLVDTTTFESAANASNLPLPEIMYRGQKVDDFCYLLFAPDGSLPRGETARIRVVEGFVPVGSRDPVYTRRKDDGSPTNAYQVSVLVSGLTKTDRPM